MLRFLRYIILPVLIMTAGLACGQELVVESFSATADPMVVSLQRRDFNNQLCALVKVQIPRHGLIFEGDVVGEISYSAGEYMVYLCPGAKMFQIRGDDFYPARIKFDDYGITSLNGGIIYAMRLKVAGGVSDTKTPKGPGANYLVLKITPATGVSLKIDGQPQQVDASGNARVFLKYGSHSYTVEADGYAPASETVNITSAGKVTRDVVLKSVRATLSITPETPGCEIFVNDILRGMDTWSGQLSPGLYSYEIRKSGHESQSGTIELAANEKQTLVVAALTPFYVTLNVDCQPIGAEIYLDGERIGTSPDVFTNIPAGSHLIEIAASGYKKKSVIEDFKTGNVVNITESLSRIVAENSDSGFSGGMVAFRSIPQLYDLAVSRDGTVYFVTPNQWNTLSKEEKAKYNRRGIVLGDDEKLFCMYHFGVIGKRTFKSSSNLYGNSLFTEDEMNLVAANFNKVQAALGKVGVSFDDDYYWVQGGKQVKLGNKVRRANRDSACNRQVVARWPVGKTINTSDFIPRVSWSEYDLRVMRDNKYYFFNLSEWNELSSAEQDKYKKNGLVLRHPKGGYFCLALDDEPSPNSIGDWTDAMNLSGNLPDTNEAEYIVKNISDINYYLNAFGGKKLFSGWNSTPWYWTRNEVKNNSSKAYVMILGNGPDKSVNLQYGVGTGWKADRYRIRKISY